MTGATYESPLAMATQQKAVAMDKSWARTYAWPAIRTFIVTKPLGTIGGALILVMVLTAVFAEVLAPYDPYAIQQRLQFTPPNLQHWLGTDEFGRDMLTRLIYGARIALFIGLAAAFVGSTAGAIIGVISAYLGGKVDLILQRVMDVMLVFPSLILALAIVSVLGRSIPNHDGRVEGWNRQPGLKASAPQRPCDTRSVREVPMRPGGFHLDQAALAAGLCTQPQRSPTRESSQAQGFVDLKAKCRVSWLNESATRVGLRGCDDDA